MSEPTKGFIRLHQNPFVFGGAGLSAASFSTSSLLRWDDATPKTVFIDDKGVQTFHGKKVEPTTELDIDNVASPLPNAGQEAEIYSSFASSE